MTSTVGLLLQTETTGPNSAAGWLALSGVSVIVFLAIFAVMIAAMWKVYVKAGQPGWACLVPIYNLYILTQIAGRPAWWVALFFVPFANIVVLIIVSMDIAKAFGRSATFGFFLLCVLGGIGYLILGFGGARYIGPPAASAAAA